MAHRLPSTQLTVFSGQLIYTKILKVSHRLPEQHHESSFKESYTKYFDNVVKYISCIKIISKYSPDIILLYIVFIFLFHIEQCSSQDVL